MANEQYYLETDDRDTLRVLIAWWRGFRKETPALPLRQRYGKVDGIPFYNDSGETIPAYAYMPVTGYDTERSMVKVGKPSTTYYQNHLINRSATVEYQKTGIAQASRIQKLLYNTGTPAVGEGFGPTPGQWYATKNYPQASICQGIHDSTAKIMLATLGPIENCIGKPSASIAINDAGTINLYSGTFPLASLTIITSMTISARNLGPAVTSSDYVDVGWRLGQPVFCKICQ